MNLIDRMIATLAPQAAVKRLQARRAISILASYEAATPSRLRKFSRETRSGESLARTQTASIRQQARDLDRNHDLAHGALTTLVNNIVGPNGIGIEPQPRSADGEIMEDLAGQLIDLWKDWSRWPEVTHCHDLPAVERLMCRTWLRDGEAFCQLLEGNVANLDHRTVVPLSLEMIEPDLIPTGIDLTGRDQQGGVLLNTWGQPTAYRVLKSHPGDTVNFRSNNDLKTIPADRMLHLRRTDRIGQVRGVSDFAAVITRLEDLKDYEESERVAAKIAASMAAYIKKGTPDLYSQTSDEDGVPEPRNMRFLPGMIFDDLSPGEEIGMIDSSRPNTNLQAYRDGQLRACAAGLGASYSSISRNYNGTYSAQRQELVEQWVHYQTLANAFTSQFLQPVWERFVALAVASGKIKVPAGLAPNSLDDALFIGQSMPWIDPAKEAEANETLERNCYKSGPEIIRARGASPKDVLDQQAKWQRQKTDAGIQPAAAPDPAAAPPDTEDHQQDQETDITP
jgi:lambda family phage portal protein